jgi:hypothetical protein|tara:strand:- start:2807 stop:2977 length:171 start_codon:yes stop_codon:yes gene_type:complete
MLKTYIFQTTSESIEIVATGFRDACDTLAENCPSISIHDILAMEEHYCPDINDTIH